MHDGANRSLDRISTLCRSVSCLKDGGEVLFYSSTASSLLYFEVVDDVLSATTV